MAIRRQLQELNCRLDVIEELLRRAIRLEKVNMALIDDLTAAAAKQSSVDDSVVALLDSIAAKLTAANAKNNDPAIAAVIAGLTQEQDKITAAVVRNTPVTPEQAAATP